MRLSLSLSTHVEKCIEFKVFLLHIFPHWRKMLFVFVFSYLFCRNNVRDGSVVMISFVFFLHLLLYFILLKMSASTYESNSLWYWCHRYHGCTDMLTDDEPSSTLCFHDSVNFYFGWHLSSWWWAIFPVRPLTHHPLSHPHSLVPSTNLPAQHHHSTIPSNPSVYTKRVWCS